jgi:hypothetical protein
VEPFVVRLFAQSSENIEFESHLTGID